MEDTKPNGRKKLDDLPGSDNEDFWKDAEIHTNLKPHTELSEDGHYFERIKGNEAKCKNCGWGFALDPQDEIKKGHLYANGKLII